MSYCYHDYNEFLKSQTCPVLARDTSQSLAELNGLRAHLILYKITQCNINE